MPKFKAVQDGYLSDTAQFVKAGQEVFFPEGKVPELGEGSWLVPVGEYRAPELVPIVGQTPVSSETKPKGQDFQVDRPEYDAQMAQITLAEGIRDGLIPVSAATPETPVLVSDADQAAPAQLPVIDGSPIEPDVVVSDATAPAPEATETAPVATEGTGNQEVI